MTKIEWTDETWNPVVGCSVVSPGCTNCYAMRQGPRLAANPKTPQYQGLTEPSKAGPVWNGKVAFAEHLLDKPLRWRRPRRVFVNSMGDLFHEAVPDEWIDKVFAVMALSPQHTFQVLTKRAERMRDYVTEVPDREDGIWPAAVEMAGLERARTMPDQWPLPNVWLGVSAEDQTRADERILVLLGTPAASRFVSYEPALGPVDLERGGFSLLRKVTSSTGKRWPGLDWIIAGGESGPRARPAHPDWFRALRDQCAAAGMPFFMKQMAKKRPIPADLMVRQWPGSAP